MITIYVKTGCPFCAKALAALDAYELPYTEKNVADPGIVDELVKLGGKKQEPFIVDGTTMMYESGAIIEYIEKKYAPKTGATKPKIHFAKGTDVCPS